MAKKKTRTKNQIRHVESKATPTSTRVMQVIFIIFSIMIVLSMILAATSSF